MSSDNPVDLTACFYRCPLKLREWADLLVIAPLSANTLGKIAGGLCDNLLVSTGVRR